jgi:threonine dehydratase
VVPPQYRLTLGEGHTPQTLSALVPGLALKREDFNPTGSHKDRAACYQVAAAAARGDQAVVISSSGNAAVATSRYAQLHNIPAFATVHPSTDPSKLAAICGSTTTVVVTERAVNTARKIARRFNTLNLRPSTSDDALIGYGTLADELLGADVDHHPDAIVVFATSGATALALAQRASIPHGPQVHFVQGLGNATLADPQSVSSSQSNRSAVAGRLGTRSSARADHLRAAVADSGGRGWVVDEADVEAGRDLLVSEDIDVSDESAANAFVALKLVEQGMQVTCIVSGAPPVPWGHPQAIIHAQDEHEALQLIDAQQSHG